MASITFVDYQTVIPASWLNAVNAMVYNGTVPASTLTVNNLIVNTSLSGDGVTAYMASPAPIGSVAANTGAFTTLSASSTVSGTGFTTYMASPPAIGGTAANAGSFTTLNASGQVTFTSTGAMLIPKGTDVQQPSGTAGMFRFNTTTAAFEGYNGTDWGSVGNLTINNDTTTGPNLYPVFADASSGIVGVLYTSDPNYTFSPASGTLTVPTIKATTGVTFPDLTVQKTAAGGFGFKNRIINGAFNVTQRRTDGVGNSFSSSATYQIDRWMGYCTTSGSNVSGQRVSDGAGGYMFRITGATGVSAVGFLQRIESFNSYDLAGNTATLSVDLSNTLLTTVNWNAKYANSADDFSSTTSIASGSFTVNSLMTRYSVEISIPSAATTGIQIEFTVGAQTSGTWNIKNVQLAKGAGSTVFDYRPITTELTLCQRYYYGVGGSSTYERLAFGGAWNSSTVGSAVLCLPVSLRKPSAATVNYFLLSSTAAISNGNNIGSPSNITLDMTSDRQVSIQVTVASGATTGTACLLTANGSTAFKNLLYVSNEL